MSRADREKWDARWAERNAPGDPDPWLLGLDDILPRKGRALDVAGGAGRHAIWLQRRGLDVTLADVSPVALEIARRACPGLTTVEIDFETDPFPPGPWDVILSFHYLQRSLFPVFPRVLAPGGLLVFCQATRSNLERHPRPPAPFLLDDRELPSLVKDLDIVHYHEGWLHDRHEARLAARRIVIPAPPGRGTPGGASR